MYTMNTIQYFVHKNIQCECAQIWAVVGPRPYIVHISEQTNANLYMM